jgi:hypothetical protein
MHAIQSKNKISDNLSGERFPIGAWLPECAPQLKAASARRSSILEAGNGVAYISGASGVPGCGCYSKPVLEDN